ncbi:PhzF family phenazine biosynthesis protein [Hazenella sp. IB182357]|uniref:PhzF family phenazine biosynthesis protein n=1 Tax=Polycladospora coralii TaxID=2771432 RepID=A0A926NAB0_9BACL|nr:PhzF family phenazine biosynthesis protein [Polycladospora coralii]MBD1372758.1 PhzF family phenazine biosynthesis protein [Polycladospora coralii]
MKMIPVYHVDAFTTVPFGGNPAGVVPEAESLTEIEMKKIARELNLSETAFLFPTNSAECDFRVRYFTPTEEVDFCGHATVALSWLLATKYGWKDRANTIRLETNIGTVPVALSKEKEKLTAVTMTQISPKIKKVQLESDQMAQILGISTTALDQRYPLRLAYTGNWHLIVPIKSQRDIDSAKPQMEELQKLNVSQKAITTHLFTFETEEEGYDLYTRDFAPAVGIPEDPVTGAANGALAGYLFSEKILAPKPVQQLQIAQGHKAGRPGTLNVTITKDPHHSEPIIQVGGSAVITIEGKLFIPNR